MSHATLLPREICLSNISVHAVSCLELEYISRIIQGCLNNSVTKLTCEPCMSWVRIWNVPGNVNLLSQTGAPSKAHSLTFATAQLHYGLCVFHSQPMSSSDKGCHCLLSRLPSAAKPLPLDWKNPRGRKYHRLFSLCQIKEKMRGPGWTDCCFWRFWPFYFSNKHFLLLLLSSPMPPLYFPLAVFGVVPLLHRFLQGRSLAEIVVQWQSWLPGKHRALGSTPSIVRKQKNEALRVLSVSSVNPLSMASLASRFFSHGMENIEQGGILRHGRVKW